ncbi:MAG TPA: ABC transporter permease [Terriglobales bacterium]|nr:ABC transporter permease [Terriglobales bacterium]
MNTPANAVPESRVEPQAFAPADISESRRFYWLVRREIWENRSIYIAPLAVAALFLLGFLVNAFRLAANMRGDVMQMHSAIVQPFHLAGLAMMGVTTLVAVIYCVDALYGERRDRSILFWKSLPVADLTTVLAKATIPIVVLPLLGFAVTIAMHWIMLVISAVVLMAQGLSVATLWAHLALPHMWATLLYHLGAIHGLWFAPFYGWLLLVSAWSPRVPFLWAVLPPFAVIALERVAFNSTHLASMLRRYMMAAPAGAEFPPTEASMHSMAHFGVGQFLVSPGLWIGLAITAAFLYAAARLRKYRGPI